MLAPRFYTTNVAKAAMNHPLSPSDLSPPLTLTTNCQFTTQCPPIPETRPDTDSEAYRQAYGRINGVVVVGETLAHHNFRRLARAIPADGAELLRLGQMEGNHARELSQCARNLGVRPDIRLAKQLFAPLQQLFRQCVERGDITGCVVIQCLIVECIAVATYRNYLPVADALARPITSAVLEDASEHSDYGSSEAARLLRQAMAA